MRRLFIGCCAAALMACGGRVDGPPSGLGAPTVDPSTPDYPTGDFGYEVGDVVPNLAFVGYAHLNPSTTIDPKAEPMGAVRFSDYYDPDGAKGFSRLVVSVQYVWCGASNEQEDFTSGSNWTGANTMFVNFAQQYAPLGVRFLTLLQDGPVVSTSATPSDLMAWVTHHESRAAEGIITKQELTLDVLGAAAPYNVIIDTRTMRVLDVWLGFDTQMTELRKFVGPQRAGF